MAYKQRWTNYFAVLDHDGSGHVDAADATAAGKVTNLHKSILYCDSDY